MLLGRLAKYGDIEPIGSTDASATLAGHDWGYYVGDKSNGMRVYSFVAINQVDSFSGDIKDFFDYVTDHDGFPADSQNLIGMLIAKSQIPCVFVFIGLNYY